MAQQKGTLRQPVWHSPVFWWIAIIAFAALAVGMLTANFTVWSKPAVPQLPSFQREQVQQPAAQPAPVAVAPAVPAFRIHAEGPWIEIGQARNGNEVLALPIPWDQLVTWGRGIPPSPLMLELDKLDMPPANVSYGNPVSGWAGYYVLSENRVIMYGVSDYRQTEKDPQVLSYWKREVTIEGLSP